LLFHVVIWRYETSEEILLIWGNEASSITAAKTGIKYKEWSIIFWMSLWTNRVAEAG